MMSNLGQYNNQQDVPYVIAKQSFKRKPLLLLPNANVTIAYYKSSDTTECLFVFPHKAIYKLNYVVCCVTLSPAFTKCLLGKPTDFIDKQLAARTLSLLKDFTYDRAFKRLSCLLNDLRHSLEITHDEAQFNRLWAEFTQSDELLPTSDRQVQRLCKRYAGQSPGTINTIKRLARTLDADNASGLYNSLGDFADASHLARVCKQYTGQNPSHWKNSSQMFY